MVLFVDIVSYGVKTRKRHIKQAVSTILIVLNSTAAKGELIEVC